MTLPMFPDDVQTNDDTPLPLIVAKKWDFRLAYHIVDGKHVYAIQDWIRGLTGEEDIRKAWSYFKKQKTWDQMSSSTRRLPYRAADGKTYPREFISDQGLYLIAQYLRITRARPVLQEIREFLSKSGVFVDEVRIDPTKVLTSGAISPDQAIDAAIEMYRSQGKSDAWIEMRIQSKIKRDQFVKALGQAIAEVLNRKHYSLATNDIYQGLWNRTASQLKQELMVSKNGSLRDQQPMLALYYQGIAEEISAQKLGQREELLWSEGRAIIKDVAAFIGQQAQATSEYMKQDIATGRPLLIS